MSGGLATIEVGGHRYAATAVVEALAPHVSSDRLTRMQTVVAHRLGGLVLGIEDLHLSHNGFACVRTAEGVGVQDIVAAELREPYPMDEAAVHRRITAHAHHWVDLHRVETSAALMGWAQAREMAVFGAGPRGARTLDDLPVDRPLLVLFGNEKDGLRPETLEACDDCFRIPMHGFTESFNVSVSVGMTLQRLSTRIRARLAGEGRTGDLSDARRDHLLARWCVASVKRPELIVQRKLG